MEWTGEAIILSVRKHRENDVILEVMTSEHGRHLGLVRGGRSRRQQPVLQPGNEVHLTWRARLADHLGTFAVELLHGRAAGLMETPLGLHGLQHLASMLRLLPEREQHARLYTAVKLVLDHLDQPAVAGPLLVHFELALLENLGFGLDLTACAATGRTDDLAYVSPKSGRAVGREPGRPYHDKLLPLPSFLVEGQRQQGGEVSFTEIRDGFRLTAYFLEHHLSEAAGPVGFDLRSAMITSLEKHYRQNQPWDFIEDMSGQ